MIDHDHSGPRVSLPSVSPPLLRKQWIFEVRAAQRDKRSAVDVVKLAKSQLAEKRSVVEEMVEQSDLKAAAADEELWTLRQASVYISPCLFLLLCIHAYSYSCLSMSVKLILLWRACPSSLQESIVQKLR